jgi:hypothetical protein
VNCGTTRISPPTSAIEVHLLLGVREDAEVDDLVRQPVVLAEAVVTAGRDEQEESPPDLGDGLLTHPDGRSQDPLEHDPHIWSPNAQSERPPLRCSIGRRTSMKSAEGYLQQDPAGSDKGPWPAAPVVQAPPTPEPDHPAGNSVTAAEEALELALAEVDHVGEELRAMEALHDRLRGRLQQASAEADVLITRVSDSYALAQTRLEAELRLIQDRVSSLQRIRETRLGKGVADSAGIRARAEPDPETARFAVVPDPDPAPQPVPASAHVTTAAPQPAAAAAPVATAVPHPFPPVEHQEGDRRANGQGAQGQGPSDTAKTSPATNQDPEGESGAYEDHWYQVLRRDSSLGGDPA